MMMRCIDNGYKSITSTVSPYGLFYHPMQYSHLSERSQVENDEFILLHAALVSFSCEDAELLMLVSVGTTLKRWMQTTPFFYPPIGGAVASVADRSAGFTSLSFPQHLTFNRPNAHPPPPPRKKRKSTPQETDDAEGSNRGPRRTTRSLVVMM